MAPKPIRYQCIWNNREQIVFASPQTAETHEQRTCDGMNQRALTIDGALRLHAHRATHARTMYACVCCACVVRCVCWCALMYVCVWCVSDECVVDSVIEILHAHSLLSVLRPCVLVLRGSQRFVTA